MGTLARVSLFATTTIEITIALKLDFVDHESVPKLFESDADDSGHVDYNV